MKRAYKRQGQPLIVLALVSAIWIVGRIVLWQSPYPSAFSWPDFAVSGAALPTAAPLAPSLRQQSPKLPIRSAFNPVGVVSDPAASAPHVAALSAAVGKTSSVDALAGHQLMWMSAMSRIPVPSEVSALMRDASPDRQDAGKRLASDYAQQPAPNRWSLDAWALYRPNAVAGLQGIGPASYGGSQAGAVLRYRLAPGKPYEPKLYLRTTQAFANAGESEAALGISARPLVRAPVRMQAEMRLRRTAGRTSLQPAVLAVTELEPVSLPLGGQAEVYLQTGYVAGDFATPFVDGQARLTGKLTRMENARLEAGVGIWGGAQKGAARLDLGPTAGVGVKLGDVPVRLSLDYRQRVAGNAAPQSGIAVTLSTGF